MIGCLRTRVRKQPIFCFILSLRLYLGVWFAPLLLACNKVRISHNNESKQEEIKNRSIDLNNMSIYTFSKYTQKKNKLVTANNFKTDSP